MHTPSPTGPGGMSFILAGVLDTTLPKPAQYVFLSFARHIVCLSGLLDTLFLTACELMLLVM